MKDICHIDLETRSAVSIKKCGADVYAPTASILCMAWAFGDEPINLWTPKAPPPQRLLDHVHKGGKISGHNAAGFEILIWNYVGCLQHGWPELKIEQVVDSMPLGYAMGLPGDLAGLALALNSPIEKDKKGHRIMLQLSQPRSVDENGVITWWEPEDVPEKFEALYSYCKTDVEVERYCLERLMQLSPQEQEIWVKDWHINRRGVDIDQKSIEICYEIIALEKKRLDQEMRQVTKNQVATCSAVGQLTDWLKWEGIEADSVAKADVLDLLDGELPDNCRRALELRQEAAKTSTAKTNAMLAGKGLDGRMRGLFQYHGATTGRWAGRRVQLHNLPRPKLSQDRIEQAFELIHSGDSPKNIAEDLRMFFDSPLSVISDMIRGFIKAAPGKEFIGCDFSSIESRVLAWLASQEDKLEAFRTHGLIYEMSAAKVYNVDHLEDITEDQRAVGKVCDLAFGYQGGKGAFKVMAKGYNVPLPPDHEIERIKNGWRAAHESIVSYWDRLDTISMNAMSVGSGAFTTGEQGRQVSFKKDGSFLWCKLPSGRVICYPYPRLQDKETPWGQLVSGLTYMTTTMGKWARTKTYGGKLAENVTQAVARDCLSEAIPRLESKGYPVVIHVHDEAVVEVPKGFGSVEEVQEIMSQVPSWAEGLPVAAKGWRGERFRK